MHGVDKLGQIGNVPARPLDPVDRKRNATFGDLLDSDDNTLFMIDSTMKTLEDTMKRTDNLETSIKQYHDKLGHLAQKVTDLENSQRSSSIWLKAGLPVVGVAALGGAGLAVYQTLNSSNTSKKYVA